MKEIAAPSRLQAYLQEAQGLVAKGEARHVVMGNESADLDSMVSAIACGYLLSKAVAKAGPIFVPLVNVPRADYALRTEAVFLFSSLGLGPDQLSFADDVDLSALQASGDLKLVLVDHNMPAARQSSLARSVIGVIDHHRDEDAFQNLALRVVEPVGSAATLVAERLLTEDAASVEPDLAELLLGTILLDTVNLDPKALRATPKDVAIAAQLELICAADREQLFERLQEEKFNVTALDSADLLRKDFKVYRFGTVRCGIASALLPVAQWLEKDAEFAASLSAFSLAQKLDLLLVMTAYSDPEFRRELVVFCVDALLRRRVVDFLRSGDFRLVPLEHPAAPVSTDMALFSQGNTAYSRKKLQPLLQDFLG